MEIDEIIRNVVMRVITDVEKDNRQRIIPAGQIPVGISNRHLHMKQEHIDMIFGAGYQLTVLKDLSQPGQYAAQETVTIVGPLGIIQNVRILGPARPETQVELSITDGYTLGITLPVRESGNIAGSPGLTIVGPKGIVRLEQGAICAARHIHAHPAEAAKLGIKDKDIVSVKTEGDRALIFNNVLVRVNDKYAIDFHVDVDEANAAGLRMGDYVRLVKQS